MSMKELHDRLLDTVRSWQEIDRESARLLRETKEKCGNPVICQVMDIIERDTEMHTRVQQLIIESLTSKPFSLSPDELGEVIEFIRKNIELKKQKIAVTEETRGLVKDKTLLLQEFFLTYLLEDEKKHSAMLDGIERVRKSMYPYWAH
jgi:hypothetical protein